MSKFGQRIKALKPLSRIGQAINEDLRRNFASMTRSLDDSALVSYREISPKLAKEQIQEICDIFSGSSSESHIPANQVFQVARNDISLGKKSEFCSIKIFSGDGAELHYGDYGVMPSERIKNPFGLIKNKLIIPSNSVGSIAIRQHTPFCLVLNNEKIFHAFTDKEILQPVLDHEESIKRYSLTKVLSIPEDLSKRLFIKIQERIFEDRNNEKFYEEVTLKIYKPTIHNRSSGTLMSFEGEDSYWQGKVTPMHYHQGERSLYIITTKKPAAVTLNFCGVAENPDERKDCEVHLKFPENSMLVLNFPPYTHHKFHGDFVCMSVHPREGSNLIEAVQSGTLPKGFLESATVFSATEENQSKWNNSAPAIDSVIGKNSTKSR